MNRAQLQQLAQARLLDAQALLAAGRWAAAYYLVGYAVECGLKSCVLHHLEATGMIFRDRDYLKKLADCWTHDFAKLVNLAGLDAAHGTAVGANANFKRYWLTVRDWKETSRYEDRSETEARDLIEAVTTAPDGVFPWIQSHW